MQRVEELHRESMEHAEQALLARSRGESETAMELFLAAFRLEKAAADLLADKLDLEPSRSILHRSAAALALDCGETREAEKLVAQALVGMPPEDVADELRDLLEQANFMRHLRVRGVTLEPREVQLSVAGPAVGSGIAESRFLLNRIHGIEQLIFRTAERKADQPFRERGRRRKRLADLVDLFMTAPRPASLAVTLRLGHSDQLEFTDLDFAEEVLDEVLDCFELLERRQHDDLEERIPDEAYYRNFVGLARRIAPDGNDIRLVGLTKNTERGERSVALSRPAETILPPEPKQPAPPEAEPVVVTGWLRYADSLEDHREIRIVDAEGHQHYIIVPEGMMDDIVRPLWDLEVQISGLAVEGIINLEDITAADGG